MPKSKLNGNNQLDKMGSITKTRHDINVTDHIGAVYEENETGQ